MLLAPLKLYKTKKIMHNQNHEKRLSEIGYCHFWEILKERNNMTSAVCQAWGRVVMNNIIGTPATVSPSPLLPELLLCRG